MLSIAYPVLFYQGHKDNKDMKIQLELKQKQIEFLIRLIDELIAKIKSKKKDPFKYGYNEWVK